ncbi:unnamed protein product [Rotaria magnacalcarata]|uniref:Uncharacterized protein n=2 Tax=Rotaria magnacalcarata TaxID=392030 RepID=A0A815TA08_9BILA|nr:unnamed protein product [Rotaria magnacalcarata]CAF4068034.1 unnamed protein product [Rotaria magnacalcarata]
MGVETSQHRIVNIKKSPSNTSVNTALPIPKSPSDIEIEYLETFTLVWLDQHIDDDENNRILEKRLRQYITYLVTFDNQKLCEQWLQNRSTDEKIFFIVTGESGKKILPIIHDLRSIIAIYIFCWRPELHINWAKAYSKIRNIISKSEELLEQILRDKIYFENIEDAGGIKILSNQDQNEILNLEKTSFLWYQLFLELLLSSSYIQSPTSSTALLQIILRYHANNENFLNLIKEFEKTYDKEDAIQWLINNTPLERFLTKALREQNISMLFYLRFFLMDIHSQLITHQLESAHVYRKQFMSSTNIAQIQNNRNDYLVFNGFLFTSTQPPDYSLDDIDDIQYQLVLIEIYAEYRDGMPPFACVQQMVNVNNNNNNNNNNDSTIIFMCGSIFKIILFEENHNSTWNLQLSLIDDKNLSVLNDQKETLRQTKDLSIIANLLECSDQRNKANIFSEHLSRLLPSNKSLTPPIKRPANTKAKPQPLSLKNVQFIVTDLSKHLNKFAAAMLSTLQSMTNDSLLIYDNGSDFDSDVTSDKRILLFSTAQCASSTTESFKQKAQIFILEEDTNKVDLKQRFDNSEDLIFELADQLYRYYMLEAKEDSKQGNTYSAKEKEDLANRIHSELKNVFQNISTNTVDDKPTINSRTTFIQLKPRRDTDPIMKTMRKLYKNIVSDVFIFHDAEDCFGHICTAEYSNIVFLIINIQHYEESSITGFEFLENVKHTYRYDPSSIVNDRIICNPKNLRYRFTHDLIGHYNNLGNEFNQRNNTENAKEMFLKAQQLCVLLIER